MYGVIINIIFVGTMQIQPYRMISTREVKKILVEYYPFLITPVSDVLRGLFNFAIATGKGSYQTIILQGQIYTMTRNDENINKSYKELKLFKSENSFKNRDFLKMFFDFSFFLQNQRLLKSNQRFGLKLLVEYSS